MKEIYIVDIVCLGEKNKERKDIEVLIILF